MNARQIPGGGGIVSLFARHPNAANLLMVLMVIFGVAALGRINTQFFPTFNIDAVNVTVSWPGASAEDVESNVIAVIEPEVRFIDGIKEMVSYAREGSGTLSLEFNPGADMQKATADVEAAVKAVSNLPVDSESPKVSRVAFFENVARLSISGDLPESTLRLYAKKMRDDLIERGIDKVEFTGMRDEELQIEVPERELRRLGMSVDEISRIVSSNSRDTPSGQVKGQVEKQIRALADIDSPETISRLEVRSFGSGEKVLLGDIAEIKRGYKDGSVQGFVRGKRSIELLVERAPTADTLKTARIFDDYIKQAEQTLPPGITLQKYDVRANALVQRITLLVKNGLGGLILVVATLFIFLNARIAFWVAMGIPIAMFATLGFMLMLGQSINMITLFAMIMMLGIIVDDAIVVGEHTATRFEMGDEAIQAAENGAQRMLTPVMAAMTTTIASFAPMFLIGDVIGQIMGVMPYVVIAVIIASLIECFLVLPGHLAHTLQSKPKQRWSFWRQLFVASIVGFLLLAIIPRISPDTVGGPFGAILAMFSNASQNFHPMAFIFLLTIFSFAIGTFIEFFLWWLGKRNRANKSNVAQGNGQKESRFRQAFDKRFDAFRDGAFSRLLNISYHWRYVTAAIAVASIMILAVGLIRGEHVKFVFFPSPESERVLARIVFNAGIPEERALEIISKTEDALYDAVEKLDTEGEQPVVAVFATLGQAGRNVGDNVAQLRVQLTSSEERTIRTPDIVKAWRKAVPKLAGSRRIAIYEARGGPPGRDLDIEITGGNVATLKEAATEVIDIVSGIKGISGVSDDLPFGKPELVMELLPRGSALGFSIDEVGRQVRNAFEGAIPRRFARDDDEITVRVSRTSRDAGGDKLRNFELKSPAGEFVPLTEVVSLREKQGFSAIQRQDGKTIVSVTGDLDFDVITNDQMVAQLENGPMPELINRMGLEYRFSGKTEERKNSFADLQIGVIVALAVIYIILAWVFGNYFRPIAIMLIIPFGIVGAVLGHWLLGFKLTILSFIGLLGLAGILVNDSIILVSRLDERLDEGESLEEAAIGASKDRLRAVLLTSLTTIGGLIPLMFERSVQAQFLLPMAITIVFGLGMATLLVLFLVPALIGIGGDIKWFLQTLFGADRESQAEPAE